MCHKSIHLSYRINNGECMMNFFANVRNINNISFFPPCKQKTTSIFQFIMSNLVNGAGRLIFFLEGKKKKYWKSVTSAKWSI